MGRCIVILTTGVTTVLTLAFLNVDTRKDLPEVSYSTALDYFVGTCFTFVLVSIIQFSGVHFFTKHGSGEIPPETDSEQETEYQARDAEKLDNNIRVGPDNYYCVARFALKQHSLFTIHPFLLHCPCFNKCVFPANCVVITVVHFCSHFILGLFRWRTSYSALGPSSSCCFTY